MVEPETANLAGAVLDRDYQILVAFELRDKVDRRVFPPVDLALRERRRGSGRILHEIPYDAVDIDHLGTGAKARLAVRARDIFRVLLENDALAGYALGGDEFEWAGADCFLYLLKRVGLGQLLRHDRAIGLRQCIRQ